MSTTDLPKAAGPAANAPLNFGNVLQRMLGVSDKVSDLIFSPGRPPQIELLGQLQSVAVPGVEKLTPAHTASIAKIIMGTHERTADQLEKQGSTDLSFSLPGASRFRVNIFRQRGTYAIVMRVVPTTIPDFETLKLPAHLGEIANLR